MLTLLFARAGEDTAVTIAFDTLFTRLGKGFLIEKTVNTSRGTTIPPLVENLYNEFDSSSLEYRDITSQLESALTAWQQSSAGFMSQIQQVMGNVLIQAVADDVTLADPSLANSMAELVAQMLTNTQSVKACVVSVTAGSVVGNGDGVLVASAYREDGLYEQTQLAETITFTCTSSSSPDTARFSVTGTPAAQPPLDSAWPLGSGVSTGLAATAAASSLLTNGNFESSTVETDVPDGWILSVGIPSTDIRMSVPEVQTITVTGPPTAGTYQIKWVNQAGKAQTTLPLAFNASGGAVQAALRALTGLSQLTVATTGTTPLFTHTITFTGVAGNLNQVTIINNTTSGTYTPGTTTDGDALAYRGLSVIMLADGSTLACLNQPLSLSPLTQYAFSFRLAVNSAPAAGVLTVDLADGIAGAVINDEQGTPNSFAVTCSGLTSSFVPYSGVFRTPRIMPAVLYLRIRQTTAITSTTLLAIDEAAFAKMTNLYAGGPWATIFSGASPFTSGNPQNPADYVELTVANDYGGEFQSYFERNFTLSQMNLILPSVTDGSQTQDDSLIG